MWYWIIGLGCAAAGAIAVMSIMHRPWDRGFNEGWEAAKSHYQNWDEGYDQGWASCAKCMVKEARQWDEVFNHEGNKRDNDTTS